MEVVVNEKVLGFVKFKTVLVDTETAILTHDVQLSVHLARKTHKNIPEEPIALFLTRV
ncbi:uncharacterized protein PHALS_06599 [Plasmopara halstedii]|uniref:Uncharacterized protein n=1 Tax=Plasmopara halstedii TaxID=4781 RepID=A0A0P1B272_PLAHL|nr:uncharacterized protein PHALS_06599 [Plasmopara halstedii]CEG48799.1 hypothetical protein PHALS_06599 [Plasmopara halstedii]|eukprot:XP_024585168.1 hypothetical protein PHALS_06599 [Plasmopara halstedii]